VTIAKTQDHEKICLHALWHYLYTHGLYSVFVEGGFQVLRSFLQASLADAFFITISKKILSGYPIDQTLTDYLDLQHLESTNVDKDIILYGTTKG